MGKKNRTQERVKYEKIIYFVRKYNINYTQANFNITFQTLHKKKYYKCHKKKTIFLLYYNVSFTN